MSTEALAPSVDQPNLSLKTRAVTSRRRLRAESDLNEALLPFIRGRHESRITPIVRAYALELFNSEAENYRTDQDNQLGLWLNALARVIEDEIAQLRYAGSISGSLPQTVLGHLYNDSELRDIVREALKDRIGDILQRCCKPLDFVAAEQGAPDANRPSTDGPNLSLNTLAAISRRRRLAESDLNAALLPFIKHRAHKGRITPIVSTYALELFNAEAENYRTDRDNQLSIWLNILARVIEDEIVQLCYAGSVSGSIPQMVLGRLYDDSELRVVVCKSLKDRIRDILNRCYKHPDMVAKEQGTLTTRRPSDDKSAATARTVGSTHGAKKLSSGAPSKPRGRRPKKERRNAIRQAVRRQGDDWRDHLDEIFEELDERQIELGHWAGFAVQLGDRHVQKAWKWCDLGLATGDQRALIIDALRKYP